MVPCKEPLPVGCGVCVGAHARLVGVTVYRYDWALPEFVAWHRPSAARDSSRLVHELSVYALKVPLVHEADGEPHVHAPHPPGVIDVAVVCAFG
jgi:hypothetical protein